MKILYKVGTVNTDHQGISTYNVLAENAEEAVAKVKSHITELIKQAKEDGEDVTDWNDEQVETVEVEGTIDIE